MAGAQGVLLVACEGLAGPSLEGLDILPLPEGPVPRVTLTHVRSPQSPRSAVSSIPTPPRRYSSCTQGRSGLRAALPDLHE